MDAKQVAAEFLEQMKDQLGGYLANHKEAEALLVEWAEKIGVLTVKQLVPGLSDIEKSDLASEIQDYKDAVLLEADAVILDAATAAKGAFMSALETALGFALKYAPKLIALASAL